MAPERVMELSDGCKNYDEDLVLYLHDVLSPGARVRVEKHLASCPACQQRLTTLKQVSQDLAYAVRGDTLPLWTPPIPERSLPPIPKVAWLIPAFLVLVISAVITWLAFTNTIPAFSGKSQPQMAPFPEKNRIHNPAFPRPAP